MSKLVSFRFDELILKYLDEIVDDFYYKTIDTLNDELREEFKRYLSTKVSKTTVLQYIIAEKYFRMKGSYSNMEVNFEKYNKEALDRGLSEFGLSVDDLNEKQLGDMLTHALGYVDYTDKDLVREMLSIADVPFFFGDEVCDWKVQVKVSIENDEKHITEVNKSVYGFDDCKNDAFSIYAIKIDELLEKCDKYRWDDFGYIKISKYDNNNDVTLIYELSLLLNDEPYLEASEEERAMVEDLLKHK